MRTATVAIMAVAFAVAVAGRSSGAFAGAADQSGAGSSQNVVFVLLDDLDVLVGGLTPMPRVRELLQTGGTTFRQATVATPVCCPSRSILLTSKYNHNIHSTAPGNCMWVNNTSPEWADAQISRVLKRQNVPVRTAAFGKMLNNHGAFCDKNINSSIVSSWDEFLGLCSDSNFFNDTYNINGTKQEVIPGYQTAVLGNASVDFIERAVGSGERFMLYLAPHAPHIADGTYDYTCQPAPWYANATLPQDQAPRTPAWDVASPDKHWLYSQQQPMDATSVAWTDRAFRQRWRALLSVDDAVSAIHDTLVRLGVADDTTIIFTSDHGYILGSWRQPSGKWNVYDPAIRVPLLVAGPGVPAGQVSDMAVSSVDWMPTVLDILGGDSALEGFDGTSFAYELTGGRAGRRAYEARAGTFRQAALIEYWGLGNVLRGAPGSRTCGPREGVCAPGCECHLHLVDTGNNTYLGVRLVNDTHNLAYAEFYPDNQDSKLEQAPYFYELYNITADEYQLSNLAIAPSPEHKAIMDELHAYARQQFQCQGSTCA